MDRQTRSSVELFVANVTFEMFRFLMLDQDLFFVELPVAIPDRLLRTTCSVGSILWVNLNLTEK